MSSQFTMKFLLFCILSIYLPNPLFGGSVKKVVYTCVSGGYDGLISHVYVRGDWDYVCFTDNQGLLDDGHAFWQIRPMIYTELDNVRNARWSKIHPHLLLSEYDVSLYVDGNIDIIAPDVFDCVESLVENPNCLLAINKHPRRSCIYAEARKVIQLHLDDPTIIDSQMERLKKFGYPRKNGLVESNMIYRRHNETDVQRVMEEWWWWVFHFSRRDQLSFNYAIWKYNFQIFLFKEAFVRNSKYAIAYAHHGVHEWISSESQESE